MFRPPLGDAVPTLRAERREITARPLDHHLAEDAGLVQSRSAAKAVDMRAAARIASGCFSLSLSFRKGAHP